MTDSVRMLGGRHARDRPLIVLRRERSDGERQVRTLRRFNTASTSGRGRSSDHRSPAGAVPDRRPGASVGSHNGYVYDTLKPPRRDTIQGTFVGMRGLERLPNHFTVPGSDEPLFTRLPAPARLERAVRCVLVTRHAARASEECAGGRLRDVS